MGKFRRHVCGAQGISYILRGSGVREERPERAPESTRETDANTLPLLEIRDGERGGGRRGEGGGLVWIGSRASGVSSCFENNRFIEI